MFCSKCGNQLKDNVKFCNKCGTPITEVLEKETQCESVKADKSEKKEKRAKETKSGKKGKSGLLAIIIAAVVILGGGVTATVLYFNSDAYNGRKNLKLAIQCFEEGKIEEAKDYCEIVLEYDKTIVDAYLKLSEIYMENKEYEDAIEILLAGIKAVNVEADKEILCSALEDVCTEAVDSFISEGKLEEAYALLDKAKKQLEDSFYKNEKTLIYVAQADELAKQGAVCEALEILDAGVNDISSDALIERADYIKEHAMISVKGEVDSDGSFIDGWYECEFDGNGNIISQKIYDSGGALLDWREYEYEYDENCNILLYIRYDNILSERIRREYEYDMNGNILRDSLYDNDENLSNRREYEYDMNGNMLRDSVYDRDRNLSYSFKYEYEYDAEGNIRCKQMYDSDGNLDYRVEYDTNGNVLCRFEYPREGKYATYKTEYEYDENSNLLYVKMYDINGNLFEKQEYEYDDNNKLLCVQEYNSYWNEFNKQEYEYGENGNKTSYIVTRYDAEDNLIYRQVCEYDVNGKIIYDKVDYNELRGNLHWYESKNDMMGNCVEWISYDQLGNEIERKWYKYEYVFIE